MDVGGVATASVVLAYVGPWTIGHEGGLLDAWSVWSFAVVLEVFLAFMGRHLLGAGAACFDLYLCICATGTCLASVVGAPTHVYPYCGV